MTGGRASKQRSFSAKIKCEPSSDSKSVPCCRSRCQICPFIEETKTLLNKDKSKRFYIKKGFYIKKRFTGLNVDRVLSRMWVVLLHCPVLLEKFQKLIPRNVMSIKNNFIATLIPMDTAGWRTGRLLSSVGLK